VCQGFFPCSGLDGLHSGPSQILPGCLGPGSLLCRVLRADGSPDSVLPDHFPLIGSVQSCHHCFLTFCWYHLIFGHCQTRRPGLFYQMQHLKPSVHRCIMCV
jgi:hypothetical protein